MKLNNHTDTHAVLIGAGIMSATLAVLLRKLNPQIKISIYEKLDVISGESSDALNNAGTGHSGFCELNYTPENPDGSIDIHKAVEVATSFEMSREFWSYLVENHRIDDPKKFIRSIPHISFVWGEKDVEFLKKRFQALKKHPLFQELIYSENSQELYNWMPLVISDRDPSEKIAATKMNQGTDVNYGALTKMIILNLLMKEEIDLNVANEVKNLKKHGNQWEINIKNLTTNQKFNIVADFVFIGAGGGALPLLDKSGIEEANGYGGFPVSGEWLICKNSEIIAQHHAKVYGKAKIGSPPMSVPHLDSRIIGNKNELLFGPFAGFSTKFLKNGSYWDLPLSIEWDNLKPMLSAGFHNLPLTRYLIEQVRQDKSDKIQELREYFPDAIAEDWEEKTAGQRVQIIKKDKKEGGVLEFGTEIVHAKDGTLAALLGASPGASTAVKIMLDLMEKCFPENTSIWQNQLQTMIPSYKNHKLDQNYYETSRKRTSEILQLHPPTIPDIQK